VKASIATGAGRSRTNRQGLGRSAAALVAGLLVATAVAYALDALAIAGGYLAQDRALRARSRSSISTAVAMRPSSPTRLASRSDSATSRRPARPRRRERRASRVARPLT